MTDIAALASSVTVAACTYPHCGREQALVYACEDVVEQQLGSRLIDALDARAWLERVCEIEDIDAPEVVRAPSRSRAVASVDIDGRTVCIRRDRTSTSTLVHELAHLTCGVDSHRALFRDELVRLVRAHVSVDHAALLHALFVECALPVAPWPASAPRR